MFLFSIWEGVCVLNRVLKYSNGSHCSFLCLCQWDEVVLEEGFDITAHLGFNFA